MRQHEILSHTADVRVRAVGSTRAALIEAALQGMFAAAGPRTASVEGGEPEEPVERSFEVKSADFPALLVDLLNEALFNSDTRHEAYEALRFTLITDTDAKGVFLGRPIAGFETQIKAATHAGLEAKKNEEGNWEATITFDA